MSADLRTMLPPPSAPITQLPLRVSVPSDVSATTVTPSLCCVTCVTREENRTSTVGMPLSISETSGVSLCCSQCSRYGYGVSSLSSVDNSNVPMTPSGRSCNCQAGTTMPMSSSFLVTPHASRTSSVGG